MSKLRWYCVVGFMLIASVLPLDSRCKKVKNLLVKRTLQVRGNIFACGPIVGSNTGNLLAYGGFYNNQTSQAIATGDLIPFTTDSVPPVGITHGAAPFTSFTIQEAGVYLMIFKVRANFGGGGPPDVVAQFLINGTALAGGDDGGLSASFITTLATLHVGDVVAVQSTGDPFVVGTILNTTSIMLELIRIA